jgi:hypothetical protein
MSTANFYILAKPLQPDQGIKEWNAAATGQASFTLPKAEAEPEARLWKVCTAAVSPRFSVLESFAFLLFGALSLAALACCFSELLQFLSSGALNQTVHALLTR